MRFYYGNLKKFFEVSSFEKKILIQIQPNFFLINHMLRTEFKIVKKI